MERCVKNPIITARDIPEIKPHLVDVSSVFNPGAVKFKDQYLLLLRVQNRGRETFLLTARSTNGISFDIDDNMVTFAGLENVKDTIYHIYDPRITRLEDSFCIMFAMDMEKGCRLGLGRTRDFKSFEFLGIVSDNDCRNGVIFPEKFNSKYLRLDRPNKVQPNGAPATGSAICLSESSDLIHWKETKTVMEGRFHYWDELIGSGPPPVKTRDGWLHIYHGIATHGTLTSIYQAGVVLLDLENPGIVKARGRYNILEPRELYEQVGQVPNVVFPSGMIVDEYDAERYAIPESEAKLYYGAADTCVGLATTTVSQLIEACYEGDNRA